MSHLNRIVAWAGLGLVLLVAAPAAASAATRPMDSCPAQYNWDVTTQSCVYVG